MHLDRQFRLFGLTATFLAVSAGAGCGGVSSSPPPTTVQTQPVRVSTTGTLSATCGMALPPGSTQTVAVGSAVQPQATANNATPAQLVGVWEQDRWTGIGARAILTAWSGDAGASWSVPQALAFSSCATTTAPGSGFDRASDPWISFGHNGSVYASALAFSAAGYLSAGGTSAVFVARSTSAGSGWDAPVALISDSSSSGAAGPFFFNDRDSITADPNSDAVYVVWDRITSDQTGSGPAWLARTLDGGAHWTTAVLYDPGSGSQTFNNQIVLLPDGTLLDFHTLLTSVFTTSLQVVRSSDQGLTWSTVPVKVADMVSLGTTNPITQGSIRDSTLMAQVAVDPASSTIALVWQQFWYQAGVTVTNDGIALALSPDGGKTWSATPRQVNAVKTVAAFSPTVRFLPGGVLAITYYDLRDFQTGSTVLSTSAWLAESTDQGATWHELRVTGPFDLNTAPLADINPQLTATGLFLGDNQGLVASGMTLVPFMAATDSGGAHIYAARPQDPLSSPQAHVYQATAAPATVMAATVAAGQPHD
jgi:BNR repeat-like domain